jgi:hypothetical protein
VISKETPSALLTVGNAALKNSAWEAYAHYCFYREKGLRKEAFEHLDRFLQSTANWTSSQKIDFVKFLLPFFETAESTEDDLFPHPLSQKLIKPTLETWCETERTDGNPFRWYGVRYRSQEYLLRALEINPADDLARQTILKWQTDNMYFAVHHLPDFFIGEPEEYLEFGERIKQHIHQLTTTELKNYWMDELESDLELIRNYIEWKNSGHPDFSKWGQENKKCTGYGTKSYYYDQT